MTRNTDTELKRHIIYEFYAGLPNEENIIMESRGVVSGLHEVVKAICEKMEEQVRKVCYEGRAIKTESYCDEVAHLGLDTFFEEFDITLCTNYGHKPSYSGGFSPAKSFSDSENGIVCNPVINLMITGDDADKMMRTISFALGHELTHAYNMYQYARKNNLTHKQLLDNIYDVQRYSDIMATRTSPGLVNERAVGDILYKLNRMERNAYIAQLKQELEDVSDTITDSKSAWKAVLESESYQKFKSLENNMRILSGPEMSDEAKEEIVRYTNRALGKRFKNYKQTLKYYMKCWDTWKKKYLSAAAKIAHDVYDEHNATMDGNMSDNISIKP